MPPCISYLSLPISVILSMISYLSYLIYDIYYLSYLIREIIIIWYPIKHVHWRKLVKNLAGKPKYWGAKGLNNLCKHGRFSIIGARAPGLPSQSLLLWSYTCYPISELCYSTSDFLSQTILLSYNLSRLLRKLEYRLIFVALSFNLSLVYKLFNLCY